MKRVCWFWGLIVAVISQVALAEVRLPAIFGNGMVLQQKVEIPVWGWAEPGETVRVSIDGQNHAVSADAQGRWSVTLNPLHPGEPRTLLVQGGNRIELHDILVGEVWLCSGQSNMGYSVEKARANGFNGNEDDEAFNHPEIRLFQVPMNTSHFPESDVQGEWQRCTVQTVSEFSAVGFYFGRELQRRLDVPVGLVHACWWGTPIRPWIPLEAMDSDETFAGLAAKARKAAAAYAKKRNQFEQAKAEWLALPESERGASPEPPKDPYRWLPTVIYNGLIHPLGRFPLAGVAWYQGEGNVKRAAEYQDLLSLLIKGWRAQFRTDLPFFIVQLHGYGDAVAEPGPSDWAELREAQAKVRFLTNTFLTVTIDQGAPAGYDDPMHPPNKRTVAKRLAMSALREVYGDAAVPASPEFASMERGDGTVRLAFQNAGEGWITDDGQPSREFAVAGADGEFVRAEARIEGEILVLESDAVPHPVAVRYAWADHPDCNLYNAAGLPPAPFRTDFRDHMKREK